MNGYIYILGAMMCAQVPAAPSVSPSGAPVSSPPLLAASAPAPVAPATATAVPAAATPVGGLIAPEDVQDNSVIVPSFAPPVGYAPPPDVFAQETRRLFESDHAFDGFCEPLSNPVQSKDPRSLTEVRLLFIGDWSRPSTPVIGGGTIQIYGMQMRLALTERLQILVENGVFAQVSPKGGQVNLRYLQPHACG